MDIQRTAELIKKTGVDYKILAKRVGISASRLSHIDSGYNNDMAVGKLKALAKEVAKELKRSHEKVFLEMAGF